MGRLAYSIPIVLLIVLLAYFTNAQLRRPIEDGGVIDDIHLIDVLPWSYGVETLGGVMTTLISRNSIDVFKKSKLFTTTRDQQTNVTIKVFMGNWRLTKNCMLLGELNLTGIPPAPRGTPRIEVTFVLDHQNTLFVKAEDKASRKSEKIEVHDHYHKNAEYIDMLRELIEMTTREWREEREESERIGGLHSLKSYVYNIMRNLINGKDKITNKLEAEEKELKELIETSTGDNDENAIAIAVDEDMQIVVDGDMQGLGSSTSIINILMSIFNYIINFAFI